METVTTSHDTSKGGYSNDPDDYSKGGHSHDIDFKGDDLCSDFQEEEEIVHNSDSQGHGDQNKQTDHDYSREQATSDTMAWYSLGVA